MPQPVTRLCWWLSGINHGKKRSVSGFLGPKRQNVPSEGSLIAPFFMQHFLAHDMICSAKYSTTPLKPGFIFFLYWIYSFLHCKYKQYLMITGGTAWKRLTAMTRRTISSDDPGVAGDKIKIWHQVINRSAAGQHQPIGPDGQPQGRSE
jgi:hypothetical protein